MLDTIQARITARLTGENYEQEVVDDLAQTVLDRLCIRLGVNDEAYFPAVFESICVDATIKAYRRMYYEGLNSETSGSVSTSFVSDILSEYDAEINSYLDRVGDCDMGGSGRVVRFL